MLQHDVHIHGIVSCYHLEHETCYPIHSNIKGQEQDSPLIGRRL